MAKQQEVLSDRQIRNLVGGIGCANCGSEKSRMVGDYECCKSKTCYNTLNRIWIDNRVYREKVKRLVPKHGTNHDTMDQVSAVTRQ